MQNDTIGAIATPADFAGVGVIRVSRPEAFQVQEARRTVLGVLARVEASIDFPEEEIPVPQPTELQPLIQDDLLERIFSKFCIGK
jgi:tRNA U34 5-carboxymethylaminomethyl modifying GTPase MnmE/TrmE